MKINPEFGPQSAAEERSYSVEEFRVRIQAALHALMKAQGLTQEVLAERMEVSPARVSQIFSSRGNVTLRTMAEMFYAMEVKANVDCDGARLVITTCPKASADELSQVLERPVPLWTQRRVHDSTRTARDSASEAAALIRIQASPSGVEWRRAS